MTKALRALFLKKRRTEETAKREATGVREEMVKEDLEEMTEEMREMRFLRLLTRE